MNHQLSRRYFFQASTTIALAQLLSGCSGTRAMLQVLFLENSIPPQLIRDFHKSVNNRQKVDFQPETQLSQIANRLNDLDSIKKSEPKAQNFLEKIFSKSVIYPNLITMGDAWLGWAIGQNLLEPLSVKDLTNWQKLPADWQKLVRRNSDGNLADDGRIYGAPYRWGSTVIVYNSEKIEELGLTLTDWQDLWQPELRDRISLLDSPREVIGLTLKKLGKSYNTEDLNSVANLSAELSNLHRQAKLYSSDRYLEPLILGDTWAAVAWSDDVLPLLERYDELKLVIPASGTSLWADLWVKPRRTSGVTNNEAATIIDEWIDYCWRSQAAKQISLFTKGISPILSALKPAEIPQDLQDNIFLTSPTLNSDKSEFLLPLTPETERQYRDLWLEIRS